MTDDHDLETRLRDLLARRADEIDIESPAVPSAPFAPSRVPRRVALSPRARGAVAAAVVSIVIGGVIIAQRDDNTTRTTTVGTTPTTSQTVVTSTTTSPPTSKPQALAPFDEFPPKSTLAAGQACPVTVRPDGIIGRGNVALMRYFGVTASGDVMARPDAQTGMGEVPVFWFAAPEQPGGILVRGYQLDGEGLMQFNQGFARLEAEVVVTFSQSFSFGGMPPGWRHEPDVWLYVPHSGCYAIDVQGTGGYREQLVLSIVRT